MLFLLEDPGSPEKFHKFINEFLVNRPFSYIIHAKADNKKGR